MTAEQHQGGERGPEKHVCSGPFTGVLLLLAAPRSPPALMHSAAEKQAVDKLICPNAIREMAGLRPKSLRLS